MSSFALSGGVGTGFSTTIQGYIVTNAHVVKDTQKLAIIIGIPLEYDEAQIVGMDEIADIVQIKLCLKVQPKCN